ncbi:MAG: plastocyanin/azurin family copper-binding protein [Actinomycetota bacterium]
MIRTATPLLALSLLGLAACGGSDRTAGTIPAEADVIVHAKPALAWDQTNYAATGADGTVTLTLVNDSSLPHNLHIVGDDSKNADPKAPKVEVSGGNDTATGTFTLAAGTYQIVCSIAGHNSMKATLTVG